MNSAESEERKCLSEEQSALILRSQVPSAYLLFIRYSVSNKLIQVLGGVTILLEGHVRVINNRTKY